MMIETIQKFDGMTHMPFLVRGASGEDVLLYCRSEPNEIDDQTRLRRWKVWVTEGGRQPRRLPTGLPEDATECSPTAWQDEAGWHVTFIAGGADGGLRYHLYRMDGPTLDSLSQPTAVCSTRTGFVLRDRLVYADMENLIYVRQSSGDFDLELPGAFIYRLAYHSDAPDKLLISGQWQLDDDVFALEYDLATGEQAFVEHDGVPIYKWTILDDRVLFAKRIGEQFESRRIERASSSALVRRPARVVARYFPGQVRAMTTQPLEDCGCRGGAGSGGIAVTRPSCLECIEKHLGAAYVLLTEVRDGYAHRLRAIGHLHEAEDESQQWPRLHKTIREARKAYQRNGTTPDFDTLSRLIDEVKTDKE